MTTFNPPQTAQRRGTGGGCLWIGLNLMFLLFLGIGGWYGWRSWSLVQFGGTVRGRVVDIDESTDDDGTTYAPIVEYTVNDNDYQMTGTYSSPPRFEVGDRVKIYYNPDNPNVARIDDFTELWLLPLIFLPIALIGGGIFNVVMLWSFIRRRQGA